MVVYLVPLHEVRRGVRSPLGPIRRTKASSTPHLSDSQIDSRKWRDQIDDELCLDPAGPDEDELNRNTAGK
ncbi:hypothetical protein GWI33_018998 [Rhynchophorus ferrugineus]|uniref:Uncharacterized protein n=1 Tax=Rhynchophorus ferrugineus TaxID=354439 RepID=A0A834HTR4_RHYFE|nr:hypothetical protein GWI33_018998 [Rhynchophorus ferrugineus]